MLPQWIIEKKRDGHPLSDSEIGDFIARYTDGSIPDYQMAALAMAIYFQGMTDGEITALTGAMMRSGDCIDTSALKMPTADKHSTGGIGDKVSLILAPLAACAGIAVPMLSGRGLGITGGTLDKLESIPGYRTDLSAAEFMAILQACGCSITGQTARLAPADRKLYALRDVTGTVPSIPLIAASIMSKKLAEGAAHLVLDVKWGSGAFMKTVADARRLASTMVAIGHRMGRGMASRITDMNQPLGRTAGNSLEIRETVEALQGRGPQDLMEVTLALSVSMLRLTGAAADESSARRMLEDHLESGRAFEKFKQMVGLQGGDASVLDNPGRLPSAPVQCPVPALSAGFVSRMDADAIGRICLLLGAGRAAVTDRVDPRVGVSAILKIGEPVEKGQPLMLLHAADTTRLEESLQRARQAVDISEGPVLPPPLIVETVDLPEGRTP
jgi:pyrimidine-nucleoside phosphorylase